MRRTVEQVNITINNENTQQNQNALRFVMPRNPVRLREPWELVAVYLPLGIWTWSMNSQKYGENRVNLATIPQLSLMVFWNTYCRMDVLYLKKNGVLTFTVLENPTEIYQQLAELVDKKLIPDFGLDKILACDNGGRITAVEYLLRSQRIIVNPAYLAFQDDGQHSEREQRDNGRNNTILVFQKMGMFPVAV